MIRVTPGGPNISSTGRLFQIIIAPMVNYS